jgi:hypothetical protein
MAAPVNAPNAPPINAPEPVLFGEPSGLMQPESKTAMLAIIKINVCFFISKLLPTQLLIFVKQNIFPVGCLP